MQDSTVRVGVVIDWANVMKGLKDIGISMNRRTLCPVCVGEHLARGNGRGDAGTLVRLHVSRGYPPHGSTGWLRHLRARAHEQRNAWQAEHGSLVTVGLLSNQPGMGGKEVGVDVDAAAAAMAMGLSREVDVVVLFSHDSDEAPAVTRLRALPRGRRGVETASWFGLNPMNVRDRGATHDHAVRPADIEDCVQQL